MAFVRPTLSAIIQRVEGDFKASLNISTVLRRSFIAAASRAIGGATHVLHGHLVFISKQIFPDQAEEEFVDRWGSIFGLPRNEAKFAQLTIEVEFAGAGIVPAGTIWQRTDGVQYETDAEIEAFAAGNVQGTITASESGDSGNHDNGEIVSLQSPVANVSGDAVVISTIIEGEDQESDESYRQRIVDRIQQPPAGGTVNDYKQFMLDVTGVTRAWVLPAHLGEGTVGLTFVEDDDDPIIPDAAKIAEVQENVDLKKPVTANAVVFAPIENQIDFNISLKPNNSAVRDAVTAEIEDLFIRESQVKGAYKSSSETYDGKIFRSRIIEAISIAAGEEAHILNEPATDPEPGTVSGILTVGTITFQTLP